MTGTQQRRRPEDPGEMTQTSRRYIVYWAIAAGIIAGVPVLAFASRSLFAELTSNLAPADEERARNSLAFMWAAVVWFGIWIYFKGFYHRNRGRRERLLLRISLAGVVLTLLVFAISLFDLLRRLQ